MGHFHFFDTMASETKRVPATGRVQKTKCGVCYYCNKGGFDICLGKKAPFPETHYDPSIDKRCSKCSVVSDPVIKFSYGSEKFQLCRACEAKWSPATAKAAATKSGRAKPHWVAGGWWKCRCPSSGVYGNLLPYGGIHCGMCDSDVPADCICLESGQCDFCKAYYG